MPDRWHSKAFNYCLVCSAAFKVYKKAAPNVFATMTFKNMAVSRMPLDATGIMYLNAGHLQAVLKLILTSKEIDMGGLAFDGESTLRCHNQRSHNVTSKPGKIKRLSKLTMTNVLSTTTSTRTANLSPAFLGWAQATCLRIPLGLFVPLPT